MRVSRIEDYKNGWFVGNFEPAAYKADAFEVCCKFHPKGDVWDKHYHKIGTEINYLIEGRMVIQDRELIKGDIFILEPYEIADPMFIEDCTVLIVKTPSIPGDKYIVE